MFLATKNRTDSCIQLFSLAALATLVLWCPNFIENIYQLMIKEVSSNNILMIVGDVCKLVELLFYVSILQAVL